MGNASRRLYYDKPGSRIESTSLDAARTTVPVLRDVGLVAALLACACADASGPTAGSAQLRLVPVFATSTAPLVDVTGLVVSLTRADGTVAAAADVDLDLEQREVALELEVEVAQEGETLYLDLELLGLEDVPLFRNEPNPQSIAVTGADEVVEAEVALRYVGPGADVVALEIIPPNLSVLIGETISVTAVALDENGFTVSDVPIRWEILDPLVSFEGSPESPTTTLLAGILPGVARITVRDPLGHQDTATVVVLGDVIPNFEIVGGALLGPPGTGRILSDPAGIDCVITAGTPADDGCSAALPEQTWIALDATATPGSTFRGWASSLIACVGAGECRMSIVADRTAVVTAQFDILSPNAPILSAARFELLGLNLCQSPVGTGSPMVFRVDYDDPDRDVIIALSKLELGWQFLFEDGQGLGNGTGVGAIPGGFSLDLGDIGLGTLLTAPLCFTFEDTAQLDVTMVLTDAAGNVSNSVVLSIPRPEGAN